MKEKKTTERTEKALFLKRGEEINTCEDTEKKSYLSVFSVVKS